MWDDYRKEVESIHLDDDVKESLKHKVSYQMQKKIYNKFVFRFACACILILFIINHIQLDDSQKMKQSSAKEYKTSTYITKEMKNAKKYFTSVQEPMVITGTGNDIDYMVLATIISNDRADMQLPSGRKSSIGYTFSHILVQETYRGENLNNQVLETFKQGGIFPKQKIYENQNIEQENDVEYVATITEDDLMLEEGKTYLLCLNYRSEENSYEIIGKKQGIRETNIQKTDKVKKEVFKNVKVKNNETNIYEPIKDVLEEMN